MKEQEKQIVFTDKYLIANDEKISYSDLHEQHPIVEDKLSFRLGVIYARSFNKDKYAQTTHEDS